MNQVISNDKASTVFVTAGSQIAARLSFASAFASLVFLAALHILSPEFDPSWRMVSEYANGRYGWVLSLMFFSWAVSAWALAYAIGSQAKTISGRIGLALLVIAGIGEAMGGLFDINHPLHGLAAMIGIPSLPFAAILISVSLIRNPAWTSARRSLLWTAGLTWVSLVLMNIAIFTGFSPTGDISPDSWVGWANRFLVIAYNGWQMTVARSAMNGS